MNDLPYQFYKINKKSQMSTTITLGYWGIRGRGQVTRLICSYTGVEWEQKTYTSPEEWFGKDKQQLGILFPNLPYLIDGDLKISESDVLPRYVIKKSGKTELLGKDPRDMAMVDNLIYVIMDLWNPISQLFFNKKWQDEKTGVFYQLKKKFAKLEKFIGLKQTALGYLTLADFVISQFSYYVEKLFPQEYSNFKSFQNIRNTIENLQQVKNYYAQENAVQAVFLPPNMTVIPFYHEKFQPKLPPPVPSLSYPLKKSSKVNEAPQLINNGQKLKVVLINGSLRKKSTNAGILRALVEVSNPHFDFEWVDISDVPLFNEDLEAQGIPLSVERIRNQVAKAHGILFAVTQNNGSPSAAMKNIYDWLSRGGQKSVIRLIPAGMVSSGGGKGGQNAQKALRQIGEYCKVKFMESPLIAIRRWQGKFFDDNGNLIDEKTRESLRHYLQAFALWVDKNKRQ